MRLGRDLVVCRGSYSSSLTFFVHIFKAESCGLSCRSVLTKQWNMLIWVKLKIHVSCLKL